MQWNIVPGPSPRSTRYSKSRDLKKDWGRAGTTFFNVTQACKIKSCFNPRPISENGRPRCVLLLDWRTFPNGVSTNRTRNHTPDWKAFYSCYLIHTSNSCKPTSSNIFHLDRKKTSEKNEGDTRAHCIDSAHTHTRARITQPPLNHRKKRFSPTSLSMPRPSSMCPLILLLFYQALPPEERIKESSENAPFFLPPATCIQERKRPSENAPIFLPNGQTSLVKIFFFSRREKEHEMCNLLGRLKG